MNLNLNKFQLCQIIINCPHIIFKFFEYIEMTTYLNLMLTCKSFYNIGKEILPTREVKVFVAVSVSFFNFCRVEIEKNVLSDSSKFMKLFRKLNVKRCDYHQVLDEMPSVYIENTIIDFNTEEIIERISENFLYGNDKAIDRFEEMLEDVRSDISYGYLDSNPKYRHYLREYYECYKLTYIKFKLQDFINFFTVDNNVRLNKINSYKNKLGYSYRKCGISGILSEIYSYDKDLIIPGNNIEDFPKYEIIREDYNKLVKVKTPFFRITDDIINPKYVTY